MRSTITNKGIELLSRLELNEITVQFCEVRTGNGVYTQSEQIKQATALKSEKNVYPISASDITSTGVLITSVVSNIDGEGHGIVDTSYRINEIGMYVLVEGVKYLYMIAVADDDTGNTLPAYNGSNAIDFIERFNLTISNTANVTVDLTRAYALAEDLVEHTENAVTHITAEERTKWNGKENATTWVIYTLRSSGWVNGVYDLSTDYPSDSYDITDIQPVSTTTTAMRKAWSKADCGGHEQTNIITAHGAVPTIDIILGFCIRPK